MAAFEAGMRLIEDQPEVSRAIMKMFLTSTSPETHQMRTRVNEAYIAVMASNLTAANTAGQLAGWADPVIVARHMFSIYMSAFLGWGMGEIDLPTFRAAALSGICHLLAGVARGPFAASVEARLIEIRNAPPLVQYKEVHRAASHSRD
jgi:hypothetical protein